MRAYADDGYSGSNFDRPGFTEMMEDVRSGAINLILCKDLSRFGRNYIEVGRYTDFILPALGCRFVALSDQVDTMFATNDMMAFINLFNEWHPKETSKKSRAAAKIRAERGERLACRPPYGYRKSEENSKLIVPDEESSLVVKRIFDLCAGGMGPTRIGQLLEEEQILNPAVYAYRKYGFARVGCDSDRPCRWAPSTICTILDNTDYLGHTINLRYTTVSYKDKRQIVRPESEWMHLQNTHEPIIAQEVWDIVQGVRQNKRRRPKMDEQNIFSGLIVCADCGKPMRLMRSRKKEARLYSFVCGSYRNYGGSACTQHHIRQSQLEAIILEDLRRVLWFAASKEREFAEIISRKNSAETRREIRKRKLELDKMLRRDGELTSLFKRLYEDNVFGRIPDEQFRILSTGYTEEQRGLKDRIPKTEAEINRLEALITDVGRFIERAKRYTEITELTPELLRTFISKVVVHERAEKYRRSTEQKVEIHYNHIGAMDYAEHVANEEAGRTA